jgi:hypothetical protein
LRSAYRAVFAELSNCLSEKRLNLQNTARQKNNHRFMWTRISDIEIAYLHRRKELQKKRLKRPVLIGIVCGLLFMIATYFGFRGRAGGVYVFGAQNGFNSRTLSAGVFGFVLFFGLTFYHQRKGSSFLSAGNEYFRCDACTELSPRNPANTCQCGGRLEPADYFTWEE